MSPAWHEILLSTGNHRTTYGDRFAVLREVALAGRASEVLVEALEMAVGLHMAGLDREALELLDELGSFVDPSDLKPEEWPWFFNTRGMALGGLGRYREAESEYARMQQLAEQLPHGEAAKDILSTALQNRGSNALAAGDAQRAVSLLREAGLMKQELGDYLAMVDILNSFAMAVAEQGELDDAERTLGEVARLARELDNPRRIGAALGNRGSLRARRGDFQGAEQDLRLALGYAREEGDPLRELQGMMGVGSSLAQQGRLGEALRWYRRGARLAEERGAVMLEMQLRRSVALMLLRLGRPAEAVPEMKRALALAQELRQAQFAAEVLADLGALHVELGEDELASEELSEARYAFARLEDADWQARVIRNLAELTLRRDGPAAADTLWREALDLLDQHPYEAAELARRAGEAWVWAKEPQEADRWLRAELDQASQFEDGSALAWRTATAGALLNLRDRNNAGLRFLQQALAQYESLVVPGQEATQVRMDVAASLTDLGRHEEAIAEIERCLKQAEEQSDRVTRQRALGNLGETLRRLGDLSAARAALEESKALADELEDDEALTHSLGNLGLMLLQTGELDAARESFEAQRELARRLGSQNEMGSALGGLGNVELASGRPRRAVAYLRRAAEVQANFSSVAEIEDLGALLQALAEARRYDELEPVTQRLVDAAQRAHLGDKGATAIASAARVLLNQGERQKAAEFYGYSLRLQLTPTRPDAEDFTEQAMNALLRRLGLMAAHVEVDLPEDERGSFYESVLASLNVIEDDLGATLRPILDEVRTEFEKEGVFEELREEQTSDE